MLLLALLLELVYDVSIPSSNTRLSKSISSIYYPLTPFVVVLLDFESVLKITLLDEIDYVFVTRLFSKISYFLTGTCSLTGSDYFSSIYSIIYGATTGAIVVEGFNFANWDSIILDKSCLYYWTSVDL